MTRVLGQGPDPGADPRSRPWRNRSAWRCSRQWSANPSTATLAFRSLLDPIGLPQIVSGREWHIAWQRAGKERLVCLTSLIATDQPGCARFVMRSQTGAACPSRALARLAAVSLCAAALVGCAANPPRPVSSLGEAPHPGVGARFVQNRTLSGNVSLIRGMRKRSFVEDIVEDRRIRRLSCQNPL